MISLNLIPPAKKRELSLLQFYLVIKNLIIVFLFITIVCAISLLLTKIILQNYFNTIVNQNTLTTKYVRLFNKDLKEFNQYLKNIEKIQEGYVSWTKFLIRFTTLIPPEIKIYSLTINQNKILINGEAKTRGSLLELKNRLENDGLFSSVAVPLENLLKKEEINFDIKADLDLVKINQL